MDTKKADLKNGKISNDEYIEWMLIAKLFEYES